MGCLVCQKNQIEFAGNALPNEICSGEIIFEIAPRSIRVCPQCQVSWAIDSMATIKAFALNENYSRLLAYPSMSNLYGLIRDYPFKFYDPEIQAFLNEAFLFLYFQEKNFLSNSDCIQLIQFMDSPPAPIHENLKKRMVPFYEKIKPRALTTGGRVFVFLQFSPEELKIQFDETKALVAVKAIEEIYAGRSLVWTVDDNNELKSYIAATALNSGYALNSEYIKTWAEAQRSVLAFVGKKYGGNSSATIFMASKISGIEESVYADLIEWDENYHKWHG